MGSTRLTVDLPSEGRLPPFSGATGWLNSPPLTTDELRGKVVLVDFWTYSCINWLRTLGYVRAWSEKYADQGLVVVGVHTPEFPFERDVDNVRQAVKEMRVEYPVALDSDYAIWEAFSNAYWPAVYIADENGRIRYHHFGEGAYEECERVIQQLLREAGDEGIPDDLVVVADDGFEAQADWSNLESRETYLGYDQGQNFASPGGAKLEQARTYVAPEKLKLNQWALSGTGRLRGGRGCSTEPMGRSRSASTLATSISSWDRLREERPCRSPCSSTENLPAPRTALTSTNREMERCPSSGCIS